ncbi:MAG TPA: phosphotransferase, partial [Myxococcota bacterium]|nr:phosphotransferase [Myxococcota bacterium]
DDLRVWESTYLRAVREPVPLLSFTCDWLRRNAPRQAPEPVLVQGDTGPGNFIYAGSRVRAVTDWELAHLGDPMEDLALIRSRDLYYRFGDLRARFARYARLSGRPLDLARVRYYTVKAMAIVPLSLAPVMENLDPRTEHAEWIAQYVFYVRTTTEALAESLGIALEPYAPPDAPATRFSALHEILLENLRDEQLPAQGDAYLAARLELAIRLAEHLRRAERFAPAFASAELDDLGELLGRRPASVLEGQRALERGVREWGARREAELVNYFHRSALREEALMRGALGLAEGRSLSPID